MSGVLGQCNKCFCVRWLAKVTHTDARGNPHGICRSCDREEGEA
jgi:hypothetical protein